MKKCFVRLLSVLFAVVLTFSLTGCSSSNTEVTAKGYPVDENTTWGELFEHFDKEGFDVLPSEIQEQLKADLLSDAIWRNLIFRLVHQFIPLIPLRKNEKSKEQLKQSVLSSSTQHFYNENESPNNFSQKDISVLNFNLLAAPSLDDSSIEYMTTFFSYQQCPSAVIIIALQDKETGSYLACNSTCELEDHTNGSGKTYSLVD